jgi:hypothetical protein
MMMRRVCRRVDEHIPSGQHQKRRLRNTIDHQVNNHRHHNRHGKEVEQQEEAKGLGESSSESTQQCK